MSFRTVVITKQAKLSYKSGFLIIRNEDTTLIHLSEINTVIIENTASMLTTYLLCELMKQKIKVVFCDEKKNPHSELIPYYGSHNSSKKIINQSKWKKTQKQMIWTAIVTQKIKNQLIHLQKYNLSGTDKIANYLLQMRLNDSTNREGHAAKVYFNSLFGKGFNRSDNCDVNYALNYGYSILLSAFNREVVSNGYITQLGFNHKNEYNHFNLSSDLMEPFRVIVDEFVYLNKDKTFDTTYKVNLVDLLNVKIKIDGKMQFLSNAIGIYVKSIFQSIDCCDSSKIKYFEYL